MDSVLSVFGLTVGLRLYSLCFYVDDSGPTSVITKLLPRPTSHRQERSTVTRVLIDQIVIIH
jgi:hypothetical protein